MVKKVYEESSIAAIAEKIRSHTGGDKKYTVAEMADGVDEAAEAAADDKEAVTRALIERSIEEIIIPEGTKKIGPFAFCGCSQVRYIDIPDGLTSIENQAFNGVGGAYGADGKGPDGEVIIPDSVKVLETNAFVWSGVRKFIVSKYIGIIKENTFEGCGKCESYDFSRHESVPTLKDVNAFNYMPTYNKAKIYVPPELYPDWVVATNWAEYAEHIVPKPSEGLEYEYTASGYILKGRGSFEGGELSIPEKHNGEQGELAVVGISSGSFQSDENLTLIYVPSSIELIDNATFCGCANLKKIYLPGVRYVYSITLRDLPSLKYVKFGSGISDIGESAFNGCAAGAVYDFSAALSVPALNVFSPGEEFGTEPVIKVPAALYEEWKADTNWLYYADYIVAAE